MAKYHKCKDKHLNKQSPCCKELEEALHVQYQTHPKQHLTDEKEEESAEEQLVFGAVRCWHDGLIIKVFFVLPHKVVKPPPT